MVKRKFLLLEVGFFLFYFLVLQLLMDLQYILEYGNESFGHIAINRVLTTPLLALPYFMYYKWQLPLLFRRLYFRFFLTVLVFVGFIEFYLHLLDWYTAYNPLIPETMRQSAMRNLLDPVFPRQMIPLTVTHLLMLTGLAFFVKKIENELKLQRLKEQHLQLELDYLKARLHPHFFFNTLNNIYSLALDVSKETAPTVARLADLMRYIIYDGERSKVPLAKEIDFIRNYMNLEKIRYSRRTSIRFEVKGKVEDVHIEPLLFMPLIENGFKHGINHATSKAWLNATLSIDNGTIQLRVENSKVNHHKPQPGGLGIRNTRKRLSLLYPGKHTLDLRDDLHSFTSVLKLERT